MSWQSMVIDLVMFTVPNPPGSRQLMMPLMKVFEIAPAKVLHGAVRLHGLTSSPTPETQVRVACAAAGVAARPLKPSARAPRITNDLQLIRIEDLPQSFQSRTAF